MTHLFIQGYIKWSKPASSFFHLSKGYFEITIITGPAHPPLRTWNGLELGCVEGYKLVRVARFASDTYLVAVSEFLSNSCHTPIWDFDTPTYLDFGHVKNSSCNSIGA
ncbi:MAG TPA: hypothetical protein VHA52_02545 [Candidatus Babeliaceae bacterium]|nr:hypothetical protein [Candidatus Babeliaceae bacterium]